MPSLDTHALKQLFLDARTHNAWQAREVPDSLLVELVDTFKWAPTSVNCSPARVVFVKSAEAKARLKPFLFEGNEEKTMKAPATAIIGYDHKFYDQLPKLFPFADARAWFAGECRQRKGNGHSQRDAAGCLFHHLRHGHLGLIGGPMSGFDGAGASKEFFPGTDVQADILVNLGYGDPAGVKPRAPRFAFDEMAKIV